MTGNPNHDEKGRFSALKAKRDEIDKRNAEHSKALQNFPKGAMGMTPDHVKSSTEFQQHKAGFDRTHAQLRELNGHLNKHFKKELADERKKKRR